MVASASLLAERFRHFYVQSGATLFARLPMVYRLAAKILCDLNIVLTTIRPAYAA
jgi:hypothetical protein